jgi:hypothetical protein
MGAPRLGRGWRACPLHLRVAAGRRPRCRPAPRRALRSHDRHRRNGRPRGRRVFDRLLRPRSSASVGAGRAARLPGGDAGTGAGRRLPHPADLLGAGRGGLRPTNRLLAGGPRSGSGRGARVPDHEDGGHRLLPRRARAVLGHRRPRLRERAAGGGARRRRGGRAGGRGDGEERPGPAPDLAVGGDGRADAGVRAAPLGDDGRGGRLPAGALRGPAGRVAAGAGRLDRGRHRGGRSCDRARPGRPETGACRLDHEPARPDVRGRRRRRPGGRHLPPGGPRCGEGRHVPRRRGLPAQPRHDRARTSPRRGPG